MAGRKVFYTYKTKEFEDLINKVFPNKVQDCSKMFKSSATLYGRIKDPGKFLLEEIFELARLAEMEPEKVFSILVSEGGLKAKQVKKR